MADRDRNLGAYLAAGLALLCVIGAACRRPPGTAASPNYYPPQQTKFLTPRSAVDTPPDRFLAGAVEYYDGDVQILANAGAKYVGIVNVHKNYHYIAAAVGGTHYRVLSETSQTWVATVLHSAYASTPVYRTGRRKTLEVVRVEPRALSRLPGALQPPPNWWL